MDRCDRIRDGSGRKVAPLRYVLAVLAMLIAAPAGADDPDAPPDLSVSCNANGAVVVLGPNTVEPGATYYLGKDCDAFRRGMGTGRWWYAGSAFVVALDGRLLRFTGELQCRALPYCRP